MTTTTDDPEPIVRTRRTSLWSWLVRIAACAVAFAALPPAVSAPIALAIVLWPWLTVRSPWARVEVLAALGWLASLGIHFSDTGVGLEVLVYVLAGGLIGLSWLLRSLVSATRFLRRGPRVRSARRGALAAWFAVPLCGLAGALLLGSELGLRVRLWLSEPALVRTIEAVPASIAGQDLPGPGRVGLFEIRRMWRSGAEAYLVTSTGFLEETGLIYSAAGPPGAGSAVSVGRHLHGPWYTFTQGW